MFKVLAVQPGDALKFELQTRLCPPSGRRHSCACAESLQVWVAHWACAGGAASVTIPALLPCCCTARNPHAPAILAAAYAAAARREARLAANPKLPTAKQQGRKRKTAPSRAGDMRATVQFCMAFGCAEPAQ